MRVLWPAADDQRRRAVLLCLAVALWVAPEATAQRSDSRVDRILDAYGQGDASAASVELATVSNYEKFGIEFPQHASRWIQSAPEGKKDFRRRVAALFTLELAHATLPTPRIWIRVREIMEWGCEQIRSGQPTPFERTWLLAADTLIQGAGDNDLGGPHARHSQQRFPDEPRFRLAEAVARREAKITANRPGAPTRLLAYGTLDVRRDLSKVRLADTIARLTALRDDPVVGPEARLRLGILYFHLGRLAESLSELQAAFRQTNARQLREAMCLLYVALTRARNHLAVTFPFNVYETRRGANYSLSQLSRFLDRGVVRAFQQVVLQPAEALPEPSAPSGKSPIVDLRALAKGDPG